MRGINPWRESMEKSFAELGPLIKKIQQHNGFTNTEENALQKCVKSLENYYKNHFAYSIEKGSNIKDHCSTFALSQNPNIELETKVDKNAKFFYQECTNHTHEDNCSFCDLLPLTMNAIRIGLQRARDMQHIDQDTFDDFNYGGIFYF